MVSDRRNHLNINANGAKYFKLRLTDLQVLEIRDYPRFADFNPTRRFSLNNRDSQR
jgi:hypothetical protein